MSAARPSAGSTPKHRATASGTRIAHIEVSSTLPAVREDITARRPKIRHDRQVGWVNLVLRTPNCGFCFDEKSFLATHPLHNCRAVARSQRLCGAAGRRL